MLIFRDQIRICALNQIAFCISEWQAQWSPGTLRLLVCLWHKNRKKNLSGHISLSIPGRRGASPLSLAWTKPSSQVLQGSALQGCEAPLREVWPWAIIITSIVTKIFILIIRSVQPQSQPQSAGQQPRQEEPATNQHYWTFSGQRTCWPG